MKFERLNVLDYFTDTYEEDLKYGDDDTPEVDNGHDNRKSGHPKNMRAGYLESHPKYLTARRVARSRNHNNLPNIVGKFLPRRDVKDEYDYYCACMLLLLKPWRDPITDLKGPLESWADAFNTFVSSSPPIIHATLSNIQYFHECESAAKAEHDRLQRQSGIVIVGPDHNPNSDPSQMELGEDVELLRYRIEDEDIELLMSSHTSDRDMFHGRQAIEIAKELQIFSEIADDWTIRGARVNSATGDDLKRLEDWKQQLKKDVVNQNDERDDDLRTHELSIGAHMLPDVTMLTENHQACS